MRACEGCRRRKIKCDAATTNTWPCAACIRLKLHCVPPTVNFDREFAPNLQGYENAESSNGVEQYQQQISMQPQQMATPQRSVPPIYTNTMAYNDGVNVYQSGTYGEGAVGHQQPSVNYNALQNPVHAMDQNQQYNPQLYATQAQSQSQGTSSRTYEQEHYEQQNLADLLGELKMDEAGTGKPGARRIQKHGLMK
jgi:hypothetical protein